MDDLPEPIPAASLILFREAAGRAPELLMIERARTLAFAGGAVAFPGGRIDPGDLETAQGLAGDHAAAKLAAIRETIEETGLAPALSPPPSAALRRALREALAMRKLGSLLHKHALVAELDRLTPFARWMPNFRETRRFDTLFFIAKAPDGEPVADTGEAARAFWSSAADMLKGIERGEAHAIFPTRRILERLARFGSLADAQADAARFGIDTITPWIEERGGVPHLCIPEGRGYPVTSEPLATARRG